MYVKSAPGLSIRDADLLDLLPVEGRDVPSTDYWQRRLRDGDVVEAEAPAEFLPKPAGEFFQPGEVSDPEKYARALASGAITEIQPAA